MSIRFLFTCTQLLIPSLFSLNSQPQFLAKGRSQGGMQPDEFSGWKAGRFGFGYFPCGFGGSALLSLSG